MELTIDDVWYQIDSETDVPEIYIKDEQAIVISCSTVWVTRDYEMHKTKMMTATIVLPSETHEDHKPQQHVISINTHLGRIFYQ